MGVAIGAEGISFRCDGPGCAAAADIRHAAGGYAAAWEKLQRKHWGQKLIPHPATLCPRCMAELQVVHVGLDVSRETSAEGDEVMPV